MWKANNTYHFGVIYEYNGDLECKAIDDNGRPHSGIGIGSIKRYGGMKTEKSTGRLKQLTSDQEMKLKAKNTKLTPFKFFTSEEAVTWGMPLLRATYLFINEVFFVKLTKRSKGMLFSGKILPSLGVSSALDYAGVYFPRTTKIAINKATLRNYRSVSSITAHEMIHLFDDKFRKADRLSETRGEGGIYNWHGPWFQVTAKSIQNLFDGKLEKVQDWEDNLNTQYDQERDDAGLPPEDEDEESDKKSRFGYKIDIDEDDMTTHSGKPFYVVAFYMGEFLKEGVKPTSVMYALRTSDLEKAHRVSELIDTDRKPGELSKQNFVDVYRTDLKHFENFNIPSSINIKGFIKDRKKIGLQEVRLLIKHGQSMIDGSDGGSMAYVLTKIAKLPLEKP
jgi:hypothetical protein